MNIDPSSYISIHEKALLITYGHHFLSIRLVVGIVLCCKAKLHYIGVIDCDILRLSRFWNITYHDCENNHDYIIPTIFDVKLMQQVMFYKVKCVL